VNHNGSLRLAKKLVDAAARAGADAVKFQTFDSDELVTKEAAKAEYQEKNENQNPFITRDTPPAEDGSAPLTRGDKKKRGGESQYEMLKRLELPREWHAPLKKYAEKKDVIFLSTPFSLSDARFLKKLGVPALKISSSDTDNIPYLRAIAKWKLPLILSTGMSDVAEVKESVSAIRKAGNKQLIVLHCTTNYPTAADETNLRAIETLRKEFSLTVGFSDHTEGTLAAVAAVSLGASVIEKHLTLDKKMRGPDHKASLDPKEFQTMVESIRYIERALGTGKKVSFQSEKEIAKVARKSLVTAEAVKKGKKFTEQNLTTKRPGTGLPPRAYDNVLGARAARDIPADTLLKKSDYAA
jgi:sialic acid synthase SpsE